LVAITTSHLFTNLWWLISSTHHIVGEIAEQ
jgi:hypothetical protein